MKIEFEAGGELVCCNVSSCWPLFGPRCPQLWVSDVTGAMQCRLDGAVIYRQRGGTPKRSGRCRAEQRRVLGRPQKQEKPDSAVLVRSNTGELFSCTEQTCWHPYRKACEFLESDPDDSKWGFCALFFKRLTGRGTKARRCKWCRSLHVVRRG